MSYVLRNDLATFTLDADGTTGLKLTSFQRAGATQVWTNNNANLWTARCYDTTTAPLIATADFTPTAATLGAVAVQTDADGQFIEAAWSAVPIGGDSLNVTVTLRLNTGEDWLRVTIAAAWAAAATHALDSLACLLLKLDPLNDTTAHAVLPAVFGIDSKNPIQNLRFSNGVLGFPNTPFFSSLNCRFWYPAGRGWTMGVWGYYDETTSEAWMVYLEDHALEMTNVLFESDGTRLKWEEFQSQPDNVLNGNNGRTLGSGYTFCLRPLATTQQYGWWDIAAHYRARIEANPPSFYVPRKPDRTDLSQVEKDYSTFVTVQAINEIPETIDGIPGDLTTALQSVRDHCGAPAGTPLSGNIECPTHNLHIVAETANSDLRAFFAALYAAGDTFFSFWFPANDVNQGTMVVGGSPGNWAIARHHATFGDFADRRWWTNSDGVGSLRLSRTGYLAGGGVDRLHEQIGTIYYRERSFPVTGWNPATRVVSVTGSPSGSGFSGTTYIVVVPASSANPMGFARVQTLGAASVTLSTSTPVFLDINGNTVTPTAADTVKVFNNLIEPGGFCPNAIANGAAFFDRYLANTSLGVAATWGACGYYWDVYSEPTLNDQRSFATPCYRDHTGWSKIDPGYVQHPFGGGAWWKQARIDAMGRARTAARDYQQSLGRDPFFVMTGEDIDETMHGVQDWCWRQVATLKFFRNCDGFDPAIHQYKTIPLYGVVYSGATMGRGLNEEFSSWLALPAPFDDSELRAFGAWCLGSEWVHGLTWPNLSLFCADGYPLADLWDDALYTSSGGTVHDDVRRIRDLWSQIVTAESNWLIDKGFRYGRMQPPATLDFGLTDTTTGMADSTWSSLYQSGDIIWDRTAYPRAVHSIWKGDDGNLCVVLCNWTDTAARWAGTVALEVGGLPAAGSVEAERIVALGHAASGSLFGDVAFDSATGKVTIASVPAFSVMVVTLAVTSPPASLVTRLMPQYTPVRTRPTGGVNLSPRDTLALSEAVVANNVEHGNGTLAKRKGYKNVLPGTLDAALKGGAPAQSIQVVPEEWWLHRPLELGRARIEPNAIGSDVMGRRDFFNERPGFIVIPEGAQTGLRLDVQSGDPDWAIEFCICADQIPVMHSNYDSVASPLLIPIVAQKGQSTNGQWALRLIPSVDATSSDRFLAVLTLYEAGTLGAAGTPAGVDFFYSSGANRAWIEPGKRTWLAWKFIDSGGGGDITSYYRKEGDTAVSSSSQNVNATSATLRTNGVGTGAYPITLGRRPYQGATRFGIAAGAAANARVIDEIGFIGSVSELRFWLESAAGGGTTLDLPSNWGTVTAAPPAATDWYVESEIPDEQLTTDAAVESGNIVQDQDLQLYYQFRPDLIGNNPDGTANASENHRFIRPRFTRGTATDNKAWLTGADATWVDGSGALGSKALALIPPGPSGQTYAYAAATAFSGDNDSLFGQRVFCGGLRIPNADQYVNRSTTGGGYQFPSEFTIRCAHRVEALPVSPPAAGVFSTLGELCVIRRGTAPNADRYGSSPIWRLAIVWNGAAYIYRFGILDAAGAAATIDSTTVVTEGVTHVVQVAFKHDATNRTIALYVDGDREATATAVASKPWMSQTSSTDAIAPNLDTLDGRDSMFALSLGYSTETTINAATPTTWLWRCGAWFPATTPEDGIGREGSGRPYWAFHTNDTLKGVNDGIGYRGHNPFVGVLGSVQVWHRYLGEDEARAYATRAPNSEEMQRDGATMLSNWDFEEGQGCCAFDKGFLKNHLRLNPFPTSTLASGALDRVSRPPLLGVWQRRQGSTSGASVQNVYALAPGALLKVAGTDPDFYLSPLGRCMTPEMWDGPSHDLRLPTAFQFNDSLYVCTGLGPVKRITNDKVSDAGLTPLYGEIGDDQTNLGWREYDRDGTFAPIVAANAGAPAAAVFAEDRKYGWLLTPYDAETGTEGAPSRPMFLTAHATDASGNGLTLVELNCLPKPTQRQVSHINIYRTTADGGTASTVVPPFKFVGRVAVGQAETAANISFVDGVTDLKLGSECDSWLNTPPPQNARIGLAFGSRALYFGVQEAPDTLFFSRSGLPGACPKAYQIRIASGQSTELTGGVVINGRAFVFTRHATYAVYDAGGDISVNSPDLPPVQIEQIRDDLGCIAHHGIVVVEGFGAIVPTERGLYLFSGTTWQPLGGRPDDRIMEFWETLDMNASRNFVGVPLRRKQQYILYCSTVADDADGGNVRAIVWDWARNAFTFQTNRDVVAAAVIADADTGQERVYCTSRNGNIFEFDPPDLEVNADGVIAAPYSGTVQDAKLSPHDNTRYARLQLVTDNSLPTAGDGLRGVNLYVTNAGVAWTGATLPLKVVWNDDEWVTVEWANAGTTDPTGYEWRLGAIADEWESGLYGTDATNMRLLRAVVNLEPSTGTELLASIGYDELPYLEKALDPAQERGIVARLLGRGKKFKYRFRSSTLEGGSPNNPWEVVSFEADVQARGRSSYVVP